MEFDFWTTDLRLTDERTKPLLLWNQPTYVHGVEVGEVYSKMIDSLPDADSKVLFLTEFRRGYNDQVLNSDGELPPIDPYYDAGAEAARLAEAHRGNADDLYMFLSGVVDKMVIDPTIAPPFH